jgi:hypothetical protein
MMMCVCKSYFRDYWKTLSNMFGSVFETFFLEKVVGGGGGGRGRAWVRV